MKTTKRATALLLLVLTFGVSRAQHANSPAHLSRHPCTDIKELEYRKEESGTVVYLSGKPFTGNACSYFANGTVFTESEYIDGIKEGVYKIYHPNGVLETEGKLYKGLDHGIYRQYFDNGIMKYDYTYEHGKKIGYWKGYYKDGNRYTERHFVNDQLHGKVYVWDETGKLVKEY